MKWIISDGKFSMQQKGSQHRNSTGPDNPTERTSSESPVWIDIPFPVWLRVKNGSGERFDLESVVDRLSSSDIHLRMAKLVAEGDGMPIVVRFSTNPDVTIAPTLALYGIVSEVQSQSDGTYRVEIDFKRYWFFSE